MSKLPRCRCGHSESMHELDNGPCHGELGCLCDAYNSIKITSPSKSSMERAREIFESISNPNDPIKAHGCVWTCTEQEYLESLIATAIDQERELRDTYWTDILKKNGVRFK